MNFDSLKIYRGDDIFLNDKIVIKQPTLNEICDFGEERYFNAIITLTSVPADMKWQLNDYYNVDYTTLNDYDMFLNYIVPLVSSKKKWYQYMLNNEEKYSEELSNISEYDIKEMFINPLELILKDIDLGDFDLYDNQNTGQVVLYNKTEDIIIDKIIYIKLVDIIRKMHGLKRNNTQPANDTTKKMLISLERDEALKNKDTPYKSTLQPLISSLSIKCGQCGDKNIWNMKIFEFFENIKRALKIDEVDILKQSMFSGFGNPNVSNKDLDWTVDFYADKG